MKDRQHRQTFGGGVGVGNRGRIEGIVSQQERCQLNYHLHQQIHLSASPQADWIKTCEDLPEI